MTAKVPVLLIVFNRADTGKKVLDRIRAYSPDQIFLAADGPRADKNEKEACNAARNLKDAIDWPCTVRTYYIDENKGPRKFIGEAISWFFQQVEMGIILEHDCLPHPDFFPYCAFLLNQYKNEPAVMHISGTQFQDEGVTNNRILFSHYNHIWGWATWKRSWDLYDPDMTSYPDFRKSGQINSVFSTSAEIKYWNKKLAKAHAGIIQSWDFQWTFSLWKHNGLAILPGSNLISNIGFDSGAIHTKDSNHFLANRPVYPFNLKELKLPSRIQPDRESERFDFNYVFYPSFFTRLRNWLAANL